MDKDFSLQLFPFILLYLFRFFWPKVFDKILQSIEEIPFLLSIALQQTQTIRIAAFHCPLETIE